MNFLHGTNNAIMKFVKPKLINFLVMLVQQRENLLVLGSLVVDLP